MDKVLVQDQVSSRINTDYVPIKINLDNNKQLAQKYRVRGIPAMLFLDSRGNLLKRVDGFVPAENLMKVIQHLQ